MLGPWLLPGIGAASSLLLLQGAKREAIIRLLVWMAIGILIYLLYGRTHSEVNNPREIPDEPMQVMHENFSISSFNNYDHHYQGYTDDDLRRQYDRQLARRMGVRRRSSIRTEDIPPDLDCPESNYPQRREESEQGEVDTVEVTVNHQTWGQGSE